MFRNNFKFACFLLITIIFFMFSSSKSMSTDNYKVLFLTSYTPGHKVFDQQLQGIQDALSSESNNMCKVYVEYMDTTSKTIDIAHSDFEKLLNLKKDIYKDIDAIIVGDNLTLDFLLSIDNVFLPNISKFYIGIDDENLINTAKISGFSGGIEELPSIEKTIQSIDSIVNDTNKNLIFLLPDSNLYKNELIRFYSVSEKYKNLKFSHIYIPNVLNEDILSSIEDLNNRDNIVLFLEPYKDSQFTLNTHSNTCYSIFSLLDIPIFNLADYCGFDYSIGGKIINPYNQGFELGKLIYKKFFSNTQPIFIDFETSNQWVFNYDNLKQFNLKSYKFPSFVDVIGAPLPLYKQPLENIFPILVIILLLLSIISWLCFDMMKRKKYEKELYIAKKHAEDMNLAKNNFISNISHELRTPVAVIMSSSQLLKRLMQLNSCVNIESINYNFDIIEQNSNRLLRLVNNIIDVAKIDSGVVDLKLQNINIVSLVEDTVLSVVPYAQVKNIDVVFDTYTEDILTAIDVEKIERVLLNLLSNAIKFSYSGGSIYTKLTTDSRNISISIKDTGIGIDTEHLETIFKKFCQVDNGFTRNNEGSGIGLSIVKSFVDLHKGNIFVNSIKGKGTTFTILLPITTINENEVNPLLSSDKNVNVELSDIYFDRFGNN